MCSHFAPCAIWTRGLTGHPTRTKAMEDAHAAVLKLPLPAELQTLTEKQFSFFGVGITGINVVSGPGG